MSFKISRGFQRSAVIEGCSVADVVVDGSKLITERPGGDREANLTNEAKRLLKTNEIVLSQIAKAKIYLKTSDLQFVKPRGC